MEVKQCRAIRYPGLGRVMRNLDSRIHDMINYSQKSAFSHAFHRICLEERKKKDYPPGGGYCMHLSVQRAAYHPTRRHACVYPKTGTEENQRTNSRHTCIYTSLRHVRTYWVPGPKRPAGQPSTLPPLLRRTGLCSCNHSVRRCCRAWQRRRLRLAVCGTRDRLAPR